MDLSIAEISSKISNEKSQTESVNLSEVRRLPIIIWLAVDLLIVLK